MKNKAWIVTVGPAYVLFMAVLYLVVLAGVGVCAMVEQVKDNWEGNRLDPRKLWLLGASAVVQGGLLVCLL